MNKIVGIRYIGKKQEQPDGVNKSGAVWRQGQVHNFSAPMADRLLAHTDSFEMAPVDPNGETFMGPAGKDVRQTAAYINPNAMGINELALFARREFHRTIPTDGRSESDVRSDVLALMRSANLDEIAADLTASNRVPFLIMVSPEERDALNAGEVKIKIIPSETHNGEESKTAAPTLDELLTSLDKKGLLDFAEQENVVIEDKRISEERLREFLFDALSSKAA